MEFLKIRNAFPSALKSDEAQSRQYWRAGLPNLGDSGSKILASIAGD
jgi:hypothetical protein